MGRRLQLFTLARPAAVVDADRPLALVSVGGVVLLASGAVLGGVVGWPGRSGDAGVSVLAVGAVVGLLVAVVAGATLWGIRTAPGDDRTPYWDD